MRVPYKTLIFGGDVEIPYIGGTKKKIHINAGTESGKVLKLFGIGFPDPNNPNLKSDYIITIECAIPKLNDLDNKEKIAIANLSV